MFFKNLNSKKRSILFIVFIICLALSPNFSRAQTFYADINNNLSTTTDSSVQSIIKTLLAQVTSLQAELSKLQGGDKKFNIDLKIGSTGEDVVRLQSLLIDKGFLVMPAGVSKGYFGGLTQKAVMEYQKTNSIKPVFGYVGPLTRNSLNVSAQVTSVDGPTGSTNNNSNTGTNVPSIPMQSGVHLSSPGFGGGGAPAVIDSTAPVISSVSVTPLTVSSVLVSWNTDELSNSVLDYGTTTSYGVSTTSSSLSTSHSFTITGLSTTTAYHFRVSSTDGSSNVSLSSDQTLAAPAYYVDSVNGSDSNTGLSSSAPVRTIAHMEDLDTANPLNTWNLAKGSHWREIVYAPRDSMTIQAYGSGDRPLIDASDIISSSAWTLAAGTTSCYKATLPADGPTSPNQIWVWENDTRMATTSSKAACDSTVGSYYIENPYTTTPTIYVHASTGIPTTNGLTYEYSARSRAVNTSSDGVRYISLHGRRVYSNDGSIRAFTNAYIYDNLSEESYSHQYYFAGGSLVENSTAHNGGYGMFVLHPGSFLANGGSGELKDSRAYNDSTTYQTGSTMFVSHTGGSPDTFGTVTIRNSTSDNIGGPAANEVSNFVITGVTVTNAPANSSGTACFQAGVGTTTISNSSCQTINGGRSIAGTNTTGEVLVLNNVTLTGNGSTAYLSGSNASLTIASSTLIGSITMSGSGSTFRGTNNVWNSPSVNDGTVTVYNLSGVTSGNFVSDYNSYLGQNFRYTIGGTVYYSLPTLRSILGQEQNSTPASLAQLFTSPTDTDLTQAGWSVQGVSSRTAGSFLENTQNLVHRVQFSLTSVTKSSALYTASAEVKPNGRNWAALSFSSSCGSWVFYDILNGVVGTTTGSTVPYSTGITALDNGYYKIWASYYANSNASANIFCASTGTGDGVNSFTGVSTNGIFDRLNKLSEGGSPL